MHTQARIGRLFVASVQWYHFNFRCAVIRRLPPKFSASDRRCDCFAPRPSLDVWGSLETVESTRDETPSVGSVERLVYAIDDSV